MSKETTLDDIAKQLAANNKTQKETNENLNKLVKLFKKQMDDDAIETQREKSNQRSEQKFNNRGGEDGGALVALAHGDILKALFGVPGLALTIGGAILTVSKFSRSIQEFFDPLNEAIKEKSEALRKKVLAGFGITTALTMFFGLFTDLGVAVAKLSTKIPLIGGIFTRIGKIFTAIFRWIKKGDNVLQRMFRLSFSNMFGFLGKLSKIFMNIFKFDVLIRGILVAIRKFNTESGDLPRRVFSALASGLSEAARVFILAIIESIPLIFQGLNFLFSDFTGWVENLGIPIISDFFGGIRNTFNWLKSFVTSNEELNSFFSTIAQQWRDSLKDNFQRLFREELPNAIMKWYDKLRSMFYNDETVNSIIEMGEIWMKSALEEVSKFFDMLGNVIGKFFSGIGDWIEDNVGFKAPKRWPWQRDPEEAPRMSRQERKRVEEIERENEQKRRAEAAAAASAPVVVTDASTQTTTNTAINTQQLLPAPPATNFRDPVYDEALN